MGNAIGSTERRELEAGLDALRLDRALAEPLLAHLALLLRWNAAYNLTAIRDPREMVAKHLLDSLAMHAATAPLAAAGGSLADLGTGAGFPGIPLAIAQPGLQVALVESNGKKARFLREAVRKLALANVRVAESRVEHVEGAFDCITARAFASLGDMLAWGGHLLAPDGRWLAQKGRLPDDELASVPDAFEVERTLALNVPGLDAERHLVILKRKRDSAAFTKAAT